MLNTTNSIDVIEQANSNSIERERKAKEAAEQQAFWDAQQLKSLKIWYILALIGFILALVSHQPIVLLGSILTFFIGIVPELWFRYALRHLLIRQEINESHVFFGEKVVLALTIENRKFLPVPSLKIEDAIHPPLTTVRGNENQRHIVRRDKIFSSWLLWSYQRVTHRYRLHCYARGFHICGPIKLTCSDPFGWLERDLTVAINQVLLVYPLIAPIETLGLPSIFPMGDFVGPRQLLEDPLWFAGNRQYQTGDDLRRIDWKATARTGELRSKIYESTTVRRLLVVLDVWTYAKELHGTDMELQEYCISVATSLAIWGLDEGYTVGLLTNGSMITARETLVAHVDTDAIERRFSDLQAQKLNAARLSPAGANVPFSADAEQYEEILTTMARLVPQYHAPIEYILEQERHLFIRGTTVLFVGAANTLSEKTIEQLQELTLYGNAIQLVLAGETQQAEEHPIDTYDLPVYFIGGRERWHELIASVDRNSAAIGTSTIGIALD
jgi:uncharacterized protein (DUF58 family)